MEKELLFSLTKDNFRFSYSRGTGAGGQKRNKTSSHVRCYHEPSNSAGECDETRSQHQNKQIAFKRCCETKTFQYWCKLEAMRVTGKLLEIEEKVDRMMQEVVVEVKENGKWVKENLKENNHGEES
jgi:hypothetical protein